MSGLQTKGDPMSNKRTKGAKPPKPLLKPPLQLCAEAIVEACKRYGFRLAVQEVYEDGQKKRQQVILVPNEPPAEGVQG